MATRSRILCTTAFLDSKRNKTIEINTAPSFETERVEYFTNELDENEYLKSFENISCCVKNPNSKSSKSVSLWGKLRSRKIFCGDLENSLTSTNENGIIIPGIVLTHASNNFCHDSNSNHNHLLETQQYLSAKNSRLNRIKLTATSSDDIVI